MTICWFWVMYFTSRICLQSISRWRVSHLSAVSCQIVWWPRIVLNNAIRRYSLSQTNEATIKSPDLTPNVEGSIYYLIHCLRASRVRPEFVQNVSASVFVCLFWRRSRCACVSLLPVPSHSSPFWRTSSWGQRAQLCTHYNNIYRWPRRLLQVVQEIHPGSTGIIIYILYTSGAWKYSTTHRILQAATLRCLQLETRA